MVGFSTSVYKLVDYDFQTWRSMGKCKQRKKTTVVLLNDMKESAEWKFNLSYLITLNTTHSEAYTSEVCMISVCDDRVTKAWGRSAKTATEILFTRIWLFLVTAWGKRQVCTLLRQRRALKSTWMRSKSHHLSQVLKPGASCINLYRDS